MTLLDLIVKKSVGKASVVGGNVESDDDDTPSSAMKTDNSVIFNDELIREIYNGSVFDPISPI